MRNSAEHPTPSHRARHRLRRRDRFESIARASRLQSLGVAAAPTRRARERRSSLTFLNPNNSRVSFAAEQFGAEDTQSAYRAVDRLPQCPKFSSAPLAIQTSFTVTSSSKLAWSHAPSPVSSLYHIGSPSNPARPFVRDSYVTLFGGTAYVSLRSSPPPPRDVVPDTAGLSTECTSVAFSTRVHSPLWHFLTVL